MNKVKKSISIIIEILLMFSIMLAVLSIFLRGILLNENIYTDILNKNNTYEQIKESVYDKMDLLLKAKNISFDIQEIKESIITEEDIKKEADNIISGLISYLETGENNIQPLDTEVYKYRVADILKSITGKITKSNANDLSFNDSLQMQNVIYTEKQFNNILLVKDNLKDEQGSIAVEKLMSRSEAEEKVRELLDKKGLTVDEAIKKAKEKGITEEQALKILAGYGITIDDEQKGTNNSQSQSASSNHSSVQDSGNTAGNSSKEVSSGSQTENAINQTSDDKNGKSQLDKITNQLINEAGSNIEKEVEKINLNKILESTKLQKVAKIISIIYKNFWILIILPFVFIAILIKINVKDLKLGLKYVRNAFLLAGLSLFAIFFGAYVLKVYDKININTAYIKDVITYTIKKFLIILSLSGATTFVVGLFLSIPAIKKPN